MIIHDLDFLRPLIAPSEYDPPLIVYSDRMPAGQVPSQGFRAISRRRHEITEHCGIVQLHRFSPGHLGHIGRTALRYASLLENQGCERAPKLLIITR